MGYLKGILQNAWGVCYIYIYPTKSAGYRAYPTKTAVLMLVILELVGLGYVDNRVEMESYHQKICICRDKGN